jgi:hypothetical protein
MLVRWLERKQLKKEKKKGKKGFKKLLKNNIQKWIVLNYKN